MNQHIITIFLFLILFADITSSAIATPITVDREALIYDGWVLSNPGDPANLPDVVESVDYGWGSDQVQGFRSRALYLPDQASAVFRFADQPLYGEISFLVYDKGAYAPFSSSTYGPRWGVQNNPAPNPIPATGSPNDQVMGVELNWKSYSDGNSNYAFDNSSNDCFSCIPPPLGPYSQPDAYRRVAGATVANPVTLTENVQGAWSRWTFAVHEGQDMTFKVTDLDVVSNQQDWTVVPMLDSIFDTGFSTTGFNQVVFHGGKASAGNEHTSDLWIDDISFVPDLGQQDADPWFYDFYDDPYLSCKERGAYADFNCDALTGLLDLDILGNNWGATGLDLVISYIHGDANEDGEVGLLDLDILGQFWGQPTPAPEPGTLSMITVAIVFATRRR